jgi:hypothetical protein
LFAAYEASDIYSSTRAHPITWLMVMLLVWSRFANLHPREVYTDDLMYAPCERAASVSDCSVGEVFEIVCCWATCTSSQAALLTKCWGLIMLCCFRSTLLFLARWRRLQACPQSSDGVAAFAGCSRSSRSAGVASWFASSGIRAKLAEQLGFGIAFWFARSVVIFAKLAGQLGFSAFLT